MKNIKNMFIDILSDTAYNDDFLDMENEIKIIENVSNAKYPLLKELILNTSFPYKPLYKIDQKDYNEVFDLLKKNEIKINETMTSEIESIYY